MRGKFIVFEGGEGCGKSTILRCIKQRLSEMGRSCVATREPGGTPYAEYLRRMMLHPEGGYRPPVISDFLAMWAARADHMVSLIEPNLRDGITVLSDRFDSSTRVYQVEASQQNNLGHLFWVLREEIVGTCGPDCYIVLDVPVEIGLRRVAGRYDEKTCFDNEHVEFHERLRAAYRELPFAMRGKARVEVIDATPALEVVQEAVWKIVTSVLNE